VYTRTVAGTATSAGRLDIYWGEAQWNISLAIANAATAAQVATAIQAAVPANFPFVATVSGAVVTLTAKNAGTVGNYLKPSVNWHQRTNYMPTGITVTTAQTTTGATDPVALNYESILGECCTVAYALLSENTAHQTALSTYLKTRWACDKPQCFGHGYVYNAGALGTVLATDINSEVLSKLDHATTHPVFPWLRTAAQAAQSACLTVDNPERNIQGSTFGVLSALRYPTSCVATRSFAERTQLQNAGFVTTVPVAGGEGTLTSDMIVNDITNSRFDANGVANTTFRDASARRLDTKIAVEFSKRLQEFNGLGYFAGTTAVREGTSGTTKNAILGNLRAWAKSNVGVLFSEFSNLNTALTVTDDFETAAKCQGTPGKLSINFEYSRPTRIVDVAVNAVPKTLTNC
jgi:phage tail sheath gpL-like